MVRAKLPHELDVGDNIFIRVAARYFNIDDVKNFEYIHTVSLTANEKKLTLEITELKSPTDQIYNITNVGLAQNVKLWMKYRDKDLFGTKTAGYLTHRIAPLETPWPIDLWAYNYSPYMDIEELQGVDVTAEVHFLGRKFYIVELVEKPDVFTEIKG